MLPTMETQDTTRALVTTLALEKEINTFFRLTSPSVIKRLARDLPRPARASRSEDRVPEMARNCANKW